MVPAGAEDFSGKRLDIASPFFADGVEHTYVVGSIQYNSQGSNQVIPIYTSTSLNSYRMGTNPWRWQFRSIDQVLDGSLGLYLTFYVQSDFPGSFSYPSLSQLDAGMRLYLPDSSYESVPISTQLKFSNFSVPVPDGGAVSPGVLIKGRVNVDSIASIDTLYLGLAKNDGKIWEIVKPAGVPGSLSLVTPSVVLVTGAASDLDSMEGLADSITQQSEILSSMYGDIMSLLNDLYARLGDMQAVQELTNTYFAQLIPLVNSINTNTANIYSLLQTQFQLLRSLIATESDDIQAAIEQQTEDLKAYFDIVFSGAVGTIPDQSEDVQSGVDSVTNAENVYESQASQRFNELSSSFASLSGDSLSAVTLVATLFNRVWNVLGDYTIVYTFPLFLGLCLLVIGRLGKSGGRASSADDPLLDDLPIHSRELSDGHKK